MQLLSYDTETGIFRWKNDRKPCIKAGDEAGSQEVNGYVCIMIDGATYKAHRLAWLFVRKRWPKIRTDHKNRIRNDNRFSNLREANGTENAVNSKVRTDNTSGHRGVSRCRNKFKKWKAQVRFNGRLIYKTFHTKTEASAFYQMHAKRLFGEFAQ